MNAATVQIECSLKINVFAEFYIGCSDAFVIFFRDFYSSDATV
jgi:hypothetical protein